jgi:hypothetical protein
MKKVAALCGLVVIALAIGPKFRRFTHGRGRRIFMGDKPVADFFRTVSKEVGLMKKDFTTC